MLWRTLYILAGLLTVALGGSLLYTFGPSGEVAFFLRVLAMALLLALAALLAVGLSYRADRARVPWFWIRRFVARQVPLEVAILLMFGVSMAIAAFPLLPEFGPLALAALGALGVAGAWAAATEHLFPYFAPPPGLVELEEVGPDAGGGRSPAKAMTG